MALREVTAQAAVAVTLVGVPQYLYLVGGVPMGALLVAATMLLVGIIGFALDASFQWILRPRRAGVPAAQVAAPR